MSVFIDTGVFYAHHDIRATHHESATAEFDVILDGRYGQPYTSDYVFDEAVTLTRSRTGSFDAANAIGRRILGEEPYPDYIRLITADTGDFRDALAAFRRYEDHDLSFTDAMIIAHCETRGIDAIVSFDDGFDGILERIQPGTT